MDRQRTGQARDRDEGLLQLPALRPVVREVERRRVGHVKAQAADETIGNQRDGGEDLFLRGDYW